MRVKKLEVVSIVLALIPLTECGGVSGNNNSSPNSPASQGIVGSWEFLAKSRITGSTTLIEANISANGSQSRNRFLIRLCSEKLN